MGGGLYHNMMPNQPQMMYPGQMMMMMPNQGMNQGMMPGMPMSSMQIPGMVGGSVTPNMFGVQQVPMQVCHSELKFSILISFLYRPNTLH